ncbi:MAG: alpha/beta hydrolase [Anaerolineae bacterium]|nr:alpha/beta hydrolase [Anaerolineae bacterium]
MRKAIGIGMAVLAVVGLGATWVYHDRLSFMIDLLKAYTAARRFYDNYEHLARDVAFHPDMARRLDVYSPPDGDGYPVLLFVHGGSWKDYDKRLFAPVAMKLLPEGMVVVIPDYTLYPDAGYEQMAHEMAAAISWTLENAGSYGGDPRQVVVAGHSSGAHLAALALMDPRFLSAYGHTADEVRGFIGLSGPYDIQAEYDYWHAQGVTPEVIVEVMGGPEHFQTASPSSYVRAGLPPILLIHGQKDETVPVEISEALYADLQAAGASATLAVYDDSGHTDFLFAALTEARAPLVVDLASFVRQHTTNKE